jgi:phosphatidylglycerol:prolipoprotein diacylglycerol transferase
MTIYPFVLELGPLEITGYGLMMMVAFLMGGWLIAIELKRRGLAEDYAADAVAAAVIGGIVGAKLWYVTVSQDMSALFSRGGLVWYGGFIGGTAAVILNGWRLKVPLRWTMQLVAPALPAAYALGRIGCLFPRGLPPSTAASMEQLFGIPVPQGIDPSTVLAVHPTQIYEAILMLAAFMWLWTLRKRGRPIGWIFGLYLVIAGVERFLIEILRAKDDRFLGPFTLAQLTSVILVGVGIWVMTRLQGSSDPEPGTYLATGKKASSPKI